MKKNPPPNTFLKGNRPATYAVYAIGCQQNWYDAEKVAHALDSAGLFPEEIESAELIIILACSVRQKAVDRIYGLIDRWRSLRPRHIVVSACVLPEDRPKIASRVEALVPDQEIFPYLEKWLGTKIDDLPQAAPGPEKREEIAGTNVDRPNTHAFVPITLGCNNFCTFCAVPHTRGREQSRPKTLVLAEVAAQVRRGLTHITLLGQNVNSYGLSDFSPRDLRKNRDRSGRAWSVEHPSPFVELLWDLERLPGLESLSFLSPNPQDFSADLINWMAHSRIFSKTLNLPLQSGSDEVLQRMNRRYSAAEYLDLVRQIKAQVPDILLSTDIIVGFPGETAADFEHTVEVARAANYERAFIGIYSPRPGTVSAKLYEDDVPYSEKHRRWSVLNELINRQSTALDSRTAARRAKMSE